MSETKQMSVNISPESVGRMLSGVTEAPWTLCAHLAHDEENGCSCGYRGVIYAGETHFAICQPGHDVIKGEEGLHPERLPRGEEVANTRFIAWAREAVPALAARVAELEAALRFIAGYAAQEPFIASDVIIVERARAALEQNGTGTRISEHGSPTFGTNISPKHISD